MRRGNGSSRCNSFHLCVDAWFVFFPLLAIRLTVFQNWCYFNKAHTEVLVTFKLLEGLNISDTLPVCVRALVSSLIKNVNLGKVAGFEKYCAAVSPPHPTPHPPGLCSVNRRRGLLLCIYKRVSTLISEYFKGT